MPDNPKRPYVLSVRAAAGTTSFGLRATTDRQAVLKALRIVDHYDIARDSGDYAIRRVDGTRVSPRHMMPWAEAAE